MAHNTNCANITEDSKCSVQHANQLQYVLFARDVLDRKLFPNEFDDWTVQEQCVWINTNIVTVFPTPHSLLNLIPASFHELNYNRSLTEKPKWFDINKYRRGQKFVHDHYGSVIISALLSLMHLYSFDDSLKPLIMSKQSTTPYLGFKRYLSTIQRFLSWYCGEPWIEGTLAYKDMQYARKMHLMMRKRLRELTHEQIENMTKLAEPWCPDRELLSKDFAAACPFSSQSLSAFLYKSSNGPKWINNMDMMIAQYGFISMVVSHPQYIGIHDATDEDLEAYCHMWRYYGYCLGIEDEYNFCRGSLEEIKQRIRDLCEYFLIPNFKDISPEWEHMTKCLIEPLNYYPGIYLPYKVAILITTDTLNFNMPNVYASLSFTEWIAYKVWTYLLRQALKFPTIRHIFNQIIRKIINAAMNFSPEKLIQLQEKSNKQINSNKKQQ